MREIKFRGKRKDNGEWVYGYYVFSENYQKLLKNGAHLIFNLDDKTVYQVIPETVGQFTGLYDNTKWEDLLEQEQKEWLKNKKKKEDWKGKEIYEGDVVERYGVLYQVRFGQFVDVKGYCQCGFYLYDLKGNVVLGNLGYSYLTDDIPLKVIGNIYENPNLLKGV